MKVLLIVPTYRYEDGYPAFLSASDFPTGIAYIASSLREAGHEVIGLNLNNIIGYDTAHHMVVNEISEALGKEPDLIGIGGLCIDYSFIKDAMGIIRYKSKVPIVLGGGIINNDTEFIFNHLKPDYCILGEAEETFVKLANGETGIDNMGYWEDDKAVFTKRSYNHRDLDDRPLPDLEAFGIGEMIDKYSRATRQLYSYSRTDPRPIGIVTARGCPFKCSFCVKHNAKYRARSIPNIMDEIKILYDKYKFNILIIQDELFAINKKRMKDFCEVLIQNKETYKWDFDWMFQTHANSKLDKETLELAKKAGCYFFSYGLESASEKILESMNKKSKPSQMIEAVELAREVGIGFGGNLLFGDTAETEETILESLDFWVNYGQDNQIFLAFVAPYPGSEIFDKCIKSGLIPDRETYYRLINRNIYNMTLMPQPTWVQWYEFILNLEKRWLFVKTVIGRFKPLVDDYYTSQVNGKLYEIKAECPFCNEKITYVEVYNKEVTQHIIGIGCTHCGRRVRVRENTP